MKKHWILPAMITLMSCIMFSASAQDTKSDKKVKLEFGIGMNFLGPQQQMADLMSKYGYAETSPGGSILGLSYPATNFPIIERKVGLNTHITLSYRITTRSQLGMMLNSSKLGEVAGNSNSKGSLTVGCKNISLVPLYIYKLNKVFEVQAGPALMINSAINTTSGQSTKHYGYAIGLLTGLNLKIWSRSVTFGNIGTNYFLTYGSNIGSYTTSKGDNSYTFPESKVNFSHLNLFFTLGFKL